MLYMKRANMKWRTSKLYAYVKHVYGSVTD